MNKTLVYLIRHGEAEGNIYKRSHGVFDSALTPKGNRQVKYLQKRFEKIQYDEVYASNLARAIDTAKGLAENKGLTLKIVPELHEVDLGIFEDCSWFEMKERFPEETEKWVNCYPDYPPQDGESAKEASDRFYNAVEGIAEDNPGKVVAVVAHASVLKLFMERTVSDDIPLSDNTAVSLFEYDHDLKKFRPLFLNDCSHLPLEIRSEPLVNGFAANSIDGYSLEYTPVFKPETVASKGIIEGVQLKQPVGFAEYVIDGNHVIIKNISIHEEVRRKGYGSQLIGEIIYRGRYFGVTDAIAATESVKDEPETIYFLKKNGFIQGQNGLWVKRLMPVAIKR